MFFTSLCGNIKMMNKDAMLKLLAVVKKTNLYPDIMVVNRDNKEDPYFKIKGEKLLTFNSCNYLGLSNHSGVKKVIAITEAWHSSCNTGP